MEIRPYCPKCGKYDVHPINPSEFFCRDCNKVFNIQQVQKSEKSRCPRCGCFDVEVNKAGLVDFCNNPDCDFDYYHDYVDDDTFVSPADEEIEQHREDYTAATSKQRRKVTRQKKIWFHKGGPKIRFYEHGSQVLRRGVHDHGARLLKRNPIIMAQTGIIWESCCKIIEAIGNKTERRNLDALAIAITYLVRKKLGQSTNLQKLCQNYAVSNPTLAENMRFIEEIVKEKPKLRKHV